MRYLNSAHYVFVTLCVFLSSFVQAYKESVLEPMLQGSDKTPALITDYKEYHTDTTVKFVVRMSEEKLSQAEAVGLHKVFKLQSSLTCNSMVNWNFGSSETSIIQVLCYLFLV